MFKKIIIYSLIFISLFLNGYLIFKPKDVKIEYIKESYGIDTIYYKVIKDTIIYNIRIKDSVIYNIKKEMKYEIEKSINYNDSATIQLFNKLSSE